jgi:DNA-binding beta-propeller fold protein YncE
MTSAHAPFGVAVTPDGRWAFVVASQAPAAVTVLRLSPRDPLSPTTTATIPLSSAGGTAMGDALTPDGRYLLVASAGGTVVISVARAEQGSASAVLGTLTAPEGAAGVEVATSLDGNFAFVSEEKNQALAVFNLGRALASGFGAADFVGTIPMGVAPVGLAISPDGRWLYATSEAGGPGKPEPGNAGTLSVIDLSRAETDPAGSVVVTVDAGCGPVRVVTSGNGADVWVTARESDDLLCFSAARLRTGPAHAIVAVVRVGEAPVGLMPVRDGTRIVVGDSNRLGAGGGSAALSVVSVAAALAGKPAVMGYLPAGTFPREMALEPGGAVLLVGNYGSSQLEAVSVAALP